MEINQKVRAKLAGKPTGRTNAISDDTRNKMRATRKLREFSQVGDTLVFENQRGERKDFSEFGHGLQKKFILGWQGGKCNRCGISEWQGVPLTLELEHIDGDRKNNARENLECLCPNCHSLTTTWRGRNKAKKVSDEELLDALITKGSIHAGLSPKGGNYKRAKLLLSLVGAVGVEPTKPFD